MKLSQRQKGTQRLRKKLKNKTATVTAQPTNSQPSFLNGVLQTVNSGQLDDAIEKLKGVSKKHPYAAYSGIGQIYILKQEFQEALNWMLKAQECDKSSLAILDNIWGLFNKLNRRTEAVEYLAKTLRLQTDMTAIRPLVKKLARSGAIADIIDILEKMIKDDPKRTDVMIELAMVYQNKGDYETAEKIYQKTIQQKPVLTAYEQLGNIYQYLGKFTESERYIRKGMKFFPDEGGFRLNLTNVLVQAGRVGESIEILQELVQANPTSPVPHGNLLLHMHYLTNLDQEILFEEHKRWAKIHAPVERAKKHHSNNPDPNRKLKIGYVSADFYTHSVGCFFESLLEGHDKKNVEIFAYGNVRRPDQTTKRMIEKFDHYRNITDMEDQEIIDIIERDQIDILVDLAGHTADNKLIAMSHKPAPVQVTWLGYPDTTGMEAIDYRFTDNIADPAGSEQFYTEKLVSLKNGFLCYRPSEAACDVGPLPALKNGYVTFGSFNNNSKNNPAIMALWAHILKANENSRMIIKFHGADDEQVKKRFYGEFAELGIDKQRIDLYGIFPHDEHFKLYNKIDIALDTYPYNGTATTCEALWMAVPVITLKGKHHASRVGSDILSRIGMEFFAASDPKEYIAKATSLAQNIESLEKIRSTMRNRVKVSSLCDYKNFARSIETEYRKMWVKWCLSQNRDANDIAEALSQERSDTNAANKFEDDAAVEDSEKSTE